MTTYITIELALLGAALVLALAISLRMGAWRR